MGPSLVLSSLRSMAADWNRTSLKSTFNNIGSSNEDDEEEIDSQAQQQNVTSNLNRTHRGIESRSPEQGLRPAQFTTVASFQSQSELNSELLREHTPPYSLRARASEEFDLGVSASTQPEPSFRLDFSLSPLLPSADTGRYLPTLGGDAISSTTRLEVNLGEEDEDNRKPAAVATRDVNPRSTNPVEGQNELISPHRKSHSISSDPFYSSSTVLNVEQHVPMTSHERFIDPTFSFEEEYEPRDFNGAQTIIPNAWVASEHTDLKFNVQRRRQFTPPHADFTAPNRSSYAVAPPQTIAYRLGDHNPDFESTLSARDVSDVVDSVVASTKARKILSNRPALPTTMHQSTRPASRSIVYHRRQASASEIESAETDRAKSAIHVWYKRFNELIEYCETYGDCNVPQKHPPNAQLGIWVNKQRMEKKFLDENKRTSMTASKVEALESIGFTWAKRKGDASWLYKYHELQRFLEQFGSCDVPTKYAPNPALGRWVSTQRSEYKIFMQTGGRSRHLTQEKIDMLNSIGFKWEMIPSRLSNSSSHSNGTSSGSSHNTNTSTHGTFIHSREV